MKKGMKVNFKIVAVVLSVVILVSFLLVGMHIDRRIEHFEPSKSDFSKPYIEMEKFDEEIYLVNDVVKQWLEGDVEGVKLYETYSSKGRILSAKVPTIRYAVYDVPQDLSIEKQEFMVSLDKNYKDAIIYTLEKDKRSLNINHLYAGKKYYYRMTAYLSDESKVECEGTFKTAKTPRILNADGVWNLRDVGGYYTQDDMRIRQGLLYRGSELDGAMYNRFVITDSGIKTLTDDLKIKSELDLRSDTTENTKDMLGEKVAHNYYGFSAYEDVFTTHGKTALKELFSDMAKPEIYPAYMHCTYGKDVTGTACYLLHSLLGVDEKQAYKDWELSVMLSGDMDYKSMKLFMEQISSLSGETMQEKTENLLLEAGVTQQEIDSIREIFLEQAK